ncbi:hypothetical protein BOTBODRAFT_387201 [Botryobasidium botryosum FD-172 SS1]|uniref:Uncharacterized protein n=1 Tax=Botryobasidium botryosum (strain FD-172 SS1) TaxID=930990 RepID=A0A067N8K0_BOTB1|nr:hypothetical protein BOTBODRAFT_387201 [Botryobasidium botryosum FD-172 SS1]
MLLSPIAWGRFSSYSWNRFQKLKALKYEHLLFASGSTDETPISAHWYQIRIRLRRGLLNCNYNAPTRFQAQYLGDRYISWHLQQ